MKKTIKYILGIPVKALLTVTYPAIYPCLIKPLDQLSGKQTGFWKGLKNLWTS